MRKIEQEWKRKEKQDKLRREGKVRRGMRKSVLSKS